MSPTSPSFLLLAASILAAGCAAPQGGSPELLASPHGTPMPASVTAPTAAPTLALAPRPTAPFRADADDERKPFGAMRIVSRFRKEEPEETSGFEGLFLYGQSTYGAIEGNLNGTRAVVDDVNNPTQFLFLPDVDPSAGMGILLGMRFRVWEVLFGYSVTDYEAQVSGVRMDTKMTYLDLLFRHYFWPDYHVQPFVVGGIGWSEAVIDNGSLDLTDPMNPVFSRGKLNDGITYNVGGGASLFLTSWLSVYGQVMWRFGEHESVTGPFGPTVTEGSIDTDAWEFATGVSLRLLKPRRGRLF